MTQTFEKNTRFGPGQKIFAGQHLLLALEVLNPPVPVRQTALANVAGPTKEADAHKVKSEENWKRLFANIRTSIVQIIQIIPIYFGIRHSVLSEKIITTDTTMIP